MASCSGMSTAGRSIASKARSLPADDRAPVATDGTTPIGMSASIKTTSLMVSARPKSPAKHFPGNGRSAATNTGRRRWRSACPERRVMALGYHARQWSRSKSTPGPNLEPSSSSNETTSSVQVDKRERAPVHAKNLIRAELGGAMGWGRGDARLPQGVRSCPLDAFSHAGADGSRRSWGTRGRRPA